MNISGVVWLKSGSAATTSRVLGDANNAVAMCMVGLMIVSATVPLASLTSRRGGKADIDDPLSNVR